MSLIAFVQCTAYNKDAPTGRCNYFRFVGAKPPATQAAAPTPPATQAAAPTNIPVAPASYIGNILHRDPPYDPPRRLEDGSMIIAGHLFPEDHLLEMTLAQMEFDPDFCPDLSHLGFETIFLPGPELEAAVPDVDAPIPASAPVVGNRVTCSHPTCSITRMHADCGHHACRKHCVALGGCMVKNHLVNVDTAVLSVSGSSNSTVTRRRLTESLQSNLAYSQLPSSSQSTTFPPLSQHSSSSDITTPSSSLAHPVVHSTTDIGDGQVDAQVDPRNISQMPPIFTNRWAENEKRQQALREAQIEEREAAERAANSVTVYLWTKVCP